MSAYVVTGGCECGRPSTVTYRDSHGFPFDEACAECDGWRPKTYRHQCELLVAEFGHFADAFNAAIGIPRLVERLSRWLSR